MRKINERYVIETYGEDGMLTDFDLDIPESFNFGYDIVDDIAAAEPDRPAMIWCNPEGEEHFFTFGDMAHWSNKVANVLASNGIGKGSMVMVILRRHYQFWFTAVALHKLGAIMVPATFMLKEHDLKYRFDSASVEAIICTDVGTIADVVDNTVTECPSVKKMFICAGGGGGVHIGEEEYGERLSGPEHICELSAEREGWIDFNAAVREASAEFERVETKTVEPLLMYFSSGTSGDPKMVLHDNAYALAHIPTAKHWHDVISDGGVHFTIADTGWGKAVWGKFYGQWIMEACVLTYDFDRFNAAEILSLIGKYKVTTMCAPTTMYRMMMLEDIDGYDLSSLYHTTTAGEALNPDLFERWREHTGLILTEGFGQTETPLTICNLNGMVPKPGSMGKPQPLYSVKILDADGNECDKGITGEICIELVQKPGWGNPPGLMMEYYRNPERTAEAMRDGWYHTGDTAWRDEDGYLWYVGRNDDVIKSSGYRIGPFEIESVLHEHAAVNECAVTGVPDPLRGAAVKATIVLSKGYEPSEELTKELQKWCKEKTAPYKYPRIIDYVAELPKTVNGKIRRSVIRDGDYETERHSLT
ncbi:MAG: AMP-binding protein [bacterium]|nr:AMP-binding protein [bacterium]